MTGRRDTKGDILREALRLFSQRGYQGTSVRDIAVAVDIKPASLYKHFAGKQAIFDGVVARMNEEYERFSLTLALPIGTPAAASDGFAALPADTMAQLGEAMFRYWTENEYAVLFRRMLTMEQFRSPAMDELYEKYFIEGPIDYQAALFAEMMHAETFCSGTPRLFAVEFFAPLLFLMQVADRCENTAELDQVVELVREHIERFVKEHGPNARD